MEYTHQQLGATVQRNTYRAYEELKGAADSRVRYRAPRYAAAEMFAGLPPSVQLDGRPCRLIDLSMTGMGLEPNPINDPTESDNDNATVALSRVGASRALKVAAGGETLFTGNVRIVRADPVKSGTRLGVQVEDGFVDLDRLRERYRRAVLRAGFAEMRRRAEADVPQAYRRACADALDIVRSTKAFLENDGDLSAGEARVLLDAVEQEVTPLWLRLCAEIDPILADVAQNDAAFRTLKDYTERVVTPEFLAGPIWWRAYAKPLGYPGDFGILDYVYAARDAGEDLYAKLLHRLGVDSLTCVETRMSMMRDLLLERLGRETSETLRVLSIGCGAAEEVRRSLSVPAARPASFTLIDQDHRALDAAYARAYPLALAAAHPVDLRCLQTGFQRLVSPRPADQSLGPQDVIYSLGLLDYLKQPRAKRLCRALYQQLAPGGLLVVANVHERMGNGRWRAECISDWSLIYRTRAQMADLAEGLDGEAQVLEDRTRNIVMLTIEKPA